MPVMSVGSPSGIGGSAGADPVDPGCFRGVWFKRYPIPVGGAKSNPALGVYRAVTPAVRAGAAP
jgi:hypothetical protein